MKEIKLFGLNASKKFAEKVSDHLDIPLSKHFETSFDDGEPYARSLENVRGKDVYVIQSLYSDKESASEKFMKLLYFLGSLRDASAERITAVVPYMDGRQDRKTESRAPIKTKYAAQLFESMGTNRFLTIDIHNLAAMQNAFRDCIPDNLEARKLLAEKTVSLLSEDEINDLVCLAPDEGGMGRTKRFRNVLQKRLSPHIKKEIGLAYVDKTHLSVGESKGQKTISAGRVVGDVVGKKIIIIDDMISGGSTVREAQKAVEECDGQIWGVCATHGLCVGSVNENLSSIPKIVITDTIENTLCGEVRDNTMVVSTAKLFAQAIRRTHEGESISALL